jgi:serine/threonine protein kinase
LAHLHANNCAHRDIKPANIYFAEDGSIRLGDFGLAKVMDGVAQQKKILEEASNVMMFVRDETHTRNVGTPAYASPEQLSGAYYGLDTDIYAMGIVFAELLAPVQTQMERAVLLEGIRSAGRLPVPVVASFEAGADIVLSMTHADAEKRPSAAQLSTLIPAALLKLQERLTRSSVYVRRVSTCSFRSVPPSSDDSRRSRGHGSYRGFGLRKCRRLAAWNSIVPSRWCSNYKSSSPRSRRLSTTGARKFQRFVQHRRMCEKQHSDQIDASAEA